MAATPMPPATPYPTPAPPSAELAGYFQDLLDGGPLYLLFHVLFFASVIVAVIIALRPHCALPWKLLAAFQPFIWASCAAHIGFLEAAIGLVRRMDLGERDPQLLIRPFVYDMHLFNWGCLISLVFIVWAFLSRAKSSAAAPQQTPPATPAQ